MAHESCPRTHLPTAHEEPEDAGDLYDNVTLLISYIHDFFKVLMVTLENDENASIAYTGDLFCEELKHRAQELYEFKLRKES